MTIFSYGTLSILLAIGTLNSLEKIYSSKTISRLGSTKYFGLTQNDMLKNRICPSVNLLPLFSSSARSTSRQTSSSVKVIRFFSVGDFALYGNVVGCGDSETPKKLNQVLSRTFRIFFY